MIGKPSSSKEAAASPRRATRPTFVVGIGASAGGLEAAQELLRGFPSDLGIAAVLVMHRSAEHRELLPELLSRVSPLPVRVASHRLKLRPNELYIAPPHSAIRVKAGRFELQREGKSGYAWVIDAFLTSLAKDFGARAMGIILSGSGTDGTVGMEAIKAEGGIAFVQDPRTAKFPGMPQQAIAAECADLVLSPSDIASELRRVAGTGLQNAPEGVLESSDKVLSRIYRMIQSRTGMDFTHYKQSTLLRRISRRMALNKVSDLPEYARCIQRKPGEADALQQEMLIHVTEFFRDPEVFEFLQTAIFPKLLEEHRADQPIRVWVPGCSTGEEAYSIAVLLCECMEAAGRELPVQIFGTDISRSAIEKARAGCYLGPAVKNVAPERLEKYFLRVEQFWKVKKNLRDLCVFAEQNVFKDPPFSKLDLISCRNLLIYFDGVLQRVVMPTFHYALRPGGILVLGSSEGIGGHSDLFDVVDKRHRIYVRKPGEARISFEHRGAVPPSKEQVLKHSGQAVERSSTAAAGAVFDPRKEAERLLLNRFGPPGVLITEDYEVLQFHGCVGDFIELRSGQATMNLLKIIRPELLMEVRAAIQASKKSDQPARRERVQIREDSRLRAVDIDVTPIRSASGRERHFLVLFMEESSSLPKKPRSTQKKSRTKDEAEEIQRLRSELKATKEFLHATIEEHESTSEELRSASEEIQSSNEELQSTNEELETAKEEVQSVNEELNTVNDELHSRNLELIQLNNDLQNLLVSVHIPIIILSKDLRIRRFTPLAEKVLNLIPSDIGRSLTDINIKIDLLDLTEVISEVLTSLVMTEREVHDPRGKWYLMRVRPFKTSEDRIDGVVLSLIDITTMKESEAAMEDARNFVQGVLEAVQTPLLVLNEELRVHAGNSAGYRAFARGRNDIEGVAIFDLDGSRWDHPEVRKLLDTAQGAAEGFREVDLPAAAGRGPVRLSARMVGQDGRARRLILLSLAENEEKS